MKKFLVFLLFAFSFSLSTIPAHAQTPPTPIQNYYKGEVVKVLKEETRNVFGNKNLYQLLEIKLLEGPKKDKIVRIENGGNTKISEEKKLKTKDQIVVLELTVGREVSYSLFDRFRLDLIIYAVIGFFALVVVASGLKGIGSIIGLIVSIMVLMQYIVPQILKGKDPLIISISGAIFIMIVTIYLAHGISRKTTVAVISTAISLTLTAIFALFFVNATKLSGLGDEASYALQLGPNAINLKGLLLGGIIIGALGVLDDITTTQSATVFELAKADPKASFSALFGKAYNVGREHISSLVNTLVLAYAGASLGVFIIFALNISSIPYWAILNSEIIVEEVVRTLAGSIGLILAVPITTFIACFWVKRSSLKS